MVNRDSFKALYPFESRFLDLGGVRYHYLDEGRGEPIVMVHGNPTWFFYYRHLIMDLRKQYRVIAPELRISKAALKATAAPPIAFHDIGEPHRERAEPLSPGDENYY